MKRSHFLTLFVLGRCTAAPPRQAVQDMRADMAGSYRRADVEGLLAHYAAGFHLQDSLGQSGNASEHDGGRAERARGWHDKASFGQVLKVELERFAHVEKAKFVLDAIHERDDGKFEVDTLFRLYATTFEGRFHHERSALTLVVESEADGE